MAGVARWCVRHSWTVVGLWLVALIALGGLDRAVGSAYSDNFNLPGTESTKALDLLQSAFPNQAGEADTIVWHVTSGKVTDPAVQQPMTAMLDKVAHGPSVRGVTSPYSPAGAAQMGCREWQRPLQNRPDNTSTPTDFCAILEFYDKP